MIMRAILTNKKTLRKFELPFISESGFQIVPSKSENMHYLI